MGVCCLHVQMIAKGGDNKDNCITNILGMDLYANMNYSFQRSIKNALASSKISFDSDENEDSRKATIATMLN